jgi:hypothetical protein
VVAFGATHAIANSVVVRSTGPSAKVYPPGKALTANATLSLKSGDMITILDNRGTRVLKGPGSVSTGAATTSTGSAFNQLLKNTGARQARTGATRSVGGTTPTRSPNLWFVDFAKSGPVCVTNAAAVSMWRPSATAAQSVTVTRVSDGKSAVIAFRPGQSVGAWPTATLPVVDGAEYRVSAPNSGNQTLKLNVIADTNAEAGRVAGSLIEKGCTSQLDLMVEAGGTAAQPAGTGE